MSLRLVVDNDRPSLVPAFYASAATTVARIREQTAPHVLAWRAKKASEERGPRRGATNVQVGDDPRAEVQNEAVAKHGLPSSRTATIYVDPGAVSPSAPPSPSSSSRWPLVLPYLTGAGAAILGWLLAYLFGGVR